jgi:hypothetical protein
LLLSSLDLRDASALLCGRFPDTTAPKGGIMSKIILQSSIVLFLAIFATLAAAQFG